MNETDYENIPEEISKSEERYKNKVLELFDEVSVWHEQVYADVIGGIFDKSHLTIYISKMISMYMHLTPKVMALKNNPDLQKRWKRYQDWQFCPWLPLEQRESMDDLPSLFILLREALEEIDITSWEK